MFFRGIQKLFLGFPKKKPDWRNNAFLVIIFTFLGIAGLPLKKKLTSVQKKLLRKLEEYIGYMISWKYRVRNHQQTVVIKLKGLCKTSSSY